MPIHNRVISTDFISIKIKYVFNKVVSYSVFCILGDALIDLIASKRERGFVYFFFF